YYCTGTDLSNLNTLTGSGINSLRIWGACAVTGALNQLPTNFTFGGFNRLHDTITTSSTTANIIPVASGDTISNLGISSSVTKTAGDSINAHNVVNVTLSDLYLANFWNGIHLNGVGSPAATCPNASQPCS